MKNETYHTEQRFYHRVNELHQLMKNDPEILGRCVDYDICIHACQYWQNEGTSISGKRVQEYQEIADELEDEINDRLTAFCEISHQIG